jgi:regulator of cell morphogenesis and NO signaling
MLQDKVGGKKMTDSNVTLAHLAVTQPGAARVFLEHGLDFCCRGRRPLSEACAEKGLDAEEVLAAIEKSAPLGDDLTVWGERPIDELIDHIVARYHARLREDFPALVAMARKVEVRHAEKPTVPSGLADHLGRMQDAAFSHLEKEERVVFPQILQTQTGGLGGPIQTLEDEHEDHGQNLLRTRELTAGLVPPPEACTTWLALYLGLERLETELMQHIHLENNVLFPRALCS